MQSQYAPKKSPIKRWASTLNHPLLIIFLSLMAIGTLLIATGSPAVAERIGAPKYHFIERHLIMLLPAIGAMIFFSMLSLKQIKLISAISLPIALNLMILTLFIGIEVKGATRWINAGPVSIQPSEFLKPFFIIVMAWLFSDIRFNYGKARSWGFASLIFLIAITILLLQPDLGMSLLITAIFGLQFFSAGLPLILVLLGIAATITLGLGAYTFLPHVKERMEKFLSGDIDANYQVSKSIEAFQNGGLFGTGPGEGNVKFRVPDAHADFIFPVAGEELGFIAVLLIIILFTLIPILSFKRMHSLLQKDAFTTIAVTGLVAQFSLQAFVNMASSLNLIPTKGMTLPFLSYGGSSLISLGIAAGMLLSLTRIRNASEFR